jgi:hypothetical protein
MVTSDVQTPVLGVALVLFLAGLLLIAASSGETLNFKIQIDPERKKPAMFGGIVAMVLGVIVGVFALVDYNGGSSTSGTTAPSTSAASPSSPSTAPEPATAAVATAVAPPTNVPVAPARKLEPAEVTVTASSTLTQSPGCGGTCYFVPDNVKDGNSSTAWAEGAAGSGVGESLHFQFEGPEHLVRMDLLPGWQRGETCLFERNGRPKKLRLVFDAQRIKDVDVPDQKGVTAITVDDTATAVEVEIREVWPGTACGGSAPDDDTLISEISFYAAG